MVFFSMVQHGGDNQTHHGNLMKRSGRIGGISIISAESELSLDAHLLLQEPNGRIPKNRLKHSPSTLGTHQMEVELTPCCYRKVVFQLQRDHAIHFHFHVTQRVPKSNPFNSSARGRPPHAAVARTHDTTTAVHRARPTNH